MIDSKFSKKTKNSLCETIFNLEKEVTVLNDTKIRRIVRTSRIWQAIHLEKASNAFCSLAKSKKKSASLANVRNTSDLNNIKDFPSEKQRSEYIADFYKRIYTKIDSNNVSIEDFLGQEITNSNYVKNKKLTDDEKNNFDLPLDVFELDNAIKKTNMNSAPGIDGWSYRGASFFWDIFRFPLTYAFNCDI